MRKHLQIGLTVIYEHQFLGALINALFKNDELHAAISEICSLVEFKIAKSTMFLGKTTTMCCVQPPSPLSLLKVAN